MATEYLHWLDRNINSYGEAGVGNGNQGLLSNRNDLWLNCIILAAVATIACDILTGSRRPISIREDIVQPVCPTGAEYSELCLPC
jgi:hypothetical protein